jgi:uncharacterized protein with beta-barrel porin domain
LKNIATANWLKIMLTSNTGARVLTDELTDQVLPKVRKKQRTRNWLHTIPRILIQLLGLGILGFQGSAWGACAGDTSVTTALVATQSNNTWLCSYSITNTGSISVTGGDESALRNTANIDAVTNNGTLSSSGVTNTYGLSNSLGSTISSLVNTGTISSGNVGLRNSSNSTILLLNNSGTISGASKGIGNTSSTLITLLNSGTISSSAGAGVYIETSNFVASVGTITNTGSIIGVTAGINNVNATLGTLNNKQGAGNANGALTYTGVLPTNYNIIIAGTSTYGKLAATAVTSSTNFGISTLSTTDSSILNSTLSGVLSGVTPAQLGFGDATTYYSTSNDYWYTLTQTDSVNNIWSLTVTCYGSGCGTTIGSGMTVGLANLSPSSRPVFAGGTLSLLNGDRSSLAFGVLSAGGTITAPTAGSATLSGVFSGVGGLTFNGTGTTIFTGANTYSGGTTVASGTLAVAGASPTGTGAVYVASAGTLMGTGTIGGNLTVAGILKPGNSPGYLVASSNVSMNAGSTYQQDIAGLTQANSTTPVGATGYYSLLSVGGQFTINTGATLAPRLSNLFSASESGYGTAIYVPSLGDRFRIVTATGGILGRFSTLTQPAELVGGTQFIAFYNVNSSNSVELAITPTSYSTTLLANTTNIKDVAKVLDQLLGVNKSGAATAAQDSLLYAVAGQTAGSLPGFAQGLSGEIHAASAATLPQAAQRVQQAVLARLGDYPMAPSQLNPALNNALLTGGISATNPSGLPTANMSTNPAVNPNTVNVTSAAVKDGRAWGEIAYQRAERASNSAGNGYNSNLYQIVTGVDAYSNAELGLKLGGGIALSNTTVSANGGNSTIQQGSLFAYGKMPVLQDYVLDGMASVGMSSTNLSRNDPTGYTGGFSSKAVLGSDALISVGLSRAFEYNDVRVTPYARLTYQYVGQNSYNEGSGVAALNIASFSGSAARGVIGVAAGSLNKEPLKDDYTYRANVSVGADTSGLLNPTLNTTLGGFSSSVTTATAGSAFVQVGLYGTVKISDNAYAYAGVSGEARSGQTLYGGSVGLRMAF